METKVNTEGTKPDRFNIDTGTMEKWRQKLTLRVQNLIALILTLELWRNGDRS